MYLWYQAVIYKLSVTVTFEFVVCDRIKPAKRKMRDFTNFDRDSFTQDLNQIDWQSIIANGSVTLLRD